jgi:hypothetical protein
VTVPFPQSYALDQAGRPYCVEMTARQGSRIWRRHVARKGLVDHLQTEVGTDRDGRSNDPGRYWSPLDDARQLGAALGAHLIRRSDPV